MKNLDILIVEDDALICNMMAMKLRKEGYTVQTATSGDEAASMLYDSNFDIIITDLMMPGETDGIDVLEMAKAKSRRVDVLLITAHASVATAVEAMRKGATDYLQKPVDFRELIMQLDKIGSIKRLAKESEDLREAMIITEANASETIQDLELRVGHLQNLVGEALHVLKQQGLKTDQRVKIALEILEGA